MREIPAQEYADAFPEQFVAFIFFNIHKTVFEPAVHQVEPVLVQGGDQFNIIHKRNPIFRDLDSQFLGKGDAQAGIFAFLLPVILVPFLFIDEEIICPIGFVPGQPVDELVS